MYGALFAKKGRKEVSFMLEYLKEEANRTLTENGAVTPASTGSDCLDLFATIGALRRESGDEIIDRFVRAYAEDRNAAMKLLFFGRDVRGGLGERRVFRVILRWLADNEPESVRKNIRLIAEFGRFDDLLSLLGTRCEKDALMYLKEQFGRDLQALERGDAVSLLGKWLPSVNTSNKETVEAAGKVRRAFGLKEAEYRKALTALRARIRILENDLREKDYTFDYEKQPSRALFKYRKAFARNDGERYAAFLDRAAKGEAVLHADNVAPYELVEPFLKGANWFRNRSYMRSISEEEKASLNATWSALPDFCGEDDTLAVIDTSGSMYCTSNPLPASVALSLGLYMAERNKGAFRGHFIEFSAHPRLIGIKGETFADRLRYAASFNEVANTDLEAVFDLILDAAVKNRVPQDELPARLVIISDMEFDSCIQNAELSNFENAKRKFEAAGYRLPEVVFWNAASRHRQQPVTLNEQGVALVSGVTPRLFGMIAGGVLSPYTFMMEVLESERYAAVTA